MNWYINVWKRFSDFGGRSPRREYWMFFLSNVIILLALQMIAHAIGTKALTYLYQLAVFVPALAVTMRRLHDTGRTGWWILISLIPFLGFIVLIIFLVQDSHTGQNQYGPNPKEGAVLA